MLESANVISCPAALKSALTVKYAKGAVGNRVEIAEGAQIAALTIDFAGKNGFVSVAPARGVKPLHAYIRVGTNSSVIIGRNLGTTGSCMMHALAGANIVIGDDCIFAREVELRNDDNHPIYDVHTGRRLNPARTITIGDHVWLARRVAVLRGTNIGNGCIVGLGSIVRGTFPNNCTIAGVPAKIVRRNVAWKRHEGAPALCWSPTVGDESQLRWWQRLLRKIIRRA